MFISKQNIVYNVCVLCLTCEVLKLQSSNKPLLGYLRVLIK